MKSEVLERAISLRMQGYSYSEIRNEIGIPKSTLSGWLANTPISLAHRLRLKSKIYRGHLLGAIAKRRQREDKVKRIKEEAIGEISRITTRQLFYMGLMLYWAEGTKEKLLGLLNLALFLILIF